MLFHCLVSGIAGRDGFADCSTLYLTDPFIDLTSLFNYLNCVGPETKFIVPLWQRERLESRSVFLLYLPILKIHREQVLVQME